MGRHLGSKNKLKKPPAIVEADVTERLKYLATLLLEIAEEELQKSEAVCSQS